MATALPLLLRLALAALVGAVLWATHAAGVQSGRSAVLADWNADKARTAQGTATAAAQALQHSAALGDTLAQLITDHQKAKAHDDQALASLLLACALALSACQSLPASPPPAPAQLCPVLPPLNLARRAPNLRQRLLQTLSPSPETATTPPTTSTPASTPTTPPAPE